MSPISNHSSFLHIGCVQTTRYLNLKFDGKYKERQSYREQVDLTIGFHVFHISIINTKNDMVRFTIGTSSINIEELS